MGGLWRLSKYSRQTEMCAFHDARPKSLRAFSEKKTKQIFCFTLSLIFVSSFFPTFEKKNS